MAKPLPRPGDVVVLSASASVQFASGRDITLRVIRIDQRPTYQGWCWLEGYELDHAGRALARRSVFVQIDGLVPSRTTRRATPQDRGPSRP